ncbi:MAG TPA: CYTH domain-containing protein [Acidimicrobiales bacterium]|nr:CYTH domain-containing protein [Acidimicrobiales bacterium]
MGVEIERKFLVDGSRFRPPAAGVEIRQGWLARDETRTVRVRLSRPTGGAGAAAGFLTVKGPGGLVRSEYEYAIPPEDAGRLLDDLCLPGEVAKVRYKVEHAGHTFEVDVYSGRLAGLVTAEVELDDPSAVVETPPWVTEEVTGDPRWSNAALSRAGSPPPDDR